MTEKDDKRKQTPAGKTGRSNKKRVPDRESLTKNAPAPRPEGPDNLRQRGEWFRRRSGGKV
jgi:hypothetical protein